MKPVAGVVDAKDIQMEAQKNGGEKEGQTELDAAEREDELAQQKWTQPDSSGPSEAFRRNFVWFFTCGTRTESTGENDLIYKLSGIDWMKFLGVLFVVWTIWLFLVCLGVMGTGFKLLGGKDSAKMFDVVSNPFSGLMVGILATVLVQSSSTSTSIIIGMVGAGEMSVATAVPMIMGANIGTSVTNTLVAIGHFQSKSELRRGFAGATVHDIFNILTVFCLLPIQWASDFMGKAAYEMVKGAKPCDEDLGDKCEKVEFIKPYLKPYISGVASYDKNVAKYVSQGYCGGKCADSPSHDELKSVTALLCGTKEHNGETIPDCSNIDGYRSSWMYNDLEIKKYRLPKFMQINGGDEPASWLDECPSDMVCEGAQPYWDRLVDAAMAERLPEAGTIVAVCESMDEGLCDKNLLKGGLMYEDWELTDTAAGALCVFFSISCLCCVIYLIVQSLQFLVKGAAARLIQRSLGMNGYVSMVIGCIVTIMVQSSSITTSTLTPLVAVGLIKLEDMYPLTLGANIGTCITGIMGASVVTSNPVEAWQVALCHLMFNLIGICIWYPVPYMRKIPISGAKKLGLYTERWGVKFPVVYTFIVFFVIPGICYGITVAAQQ